jgi:type II secretory pathway component GspD/PulD (secretin)
MVTMVRTVVDVRVISADPQHNALVANGTVDQMMTTEWLMHQLDQPAGQAAASAAPEYKMAGANGDVVRVLRMDSSATNADLTGLVTAMRTIADVQRIFPVEAQKAIVARGSADRMAIVEFLYHEIVPPAGQTASADSPVFHVTLDKPEGDNDEVQVLRIDPAATNKTLTELVTAIRTVADIQRMFPYAAEKAVIMRGPADRVAVAGWLVHELGRPSDNPTALHETQLQGIADGVVRVFYLAHQTNEVATLVSQIRTTGQIQRVFPYGQPAAVVLRGRPDQMSTVEAMVAKFDSGNQ